LAAGDPEDSLRTDVAHPMRAAARVAGIDDTRGHLLDQAELSGIIAQPSKLACG
jgi:hypothetical protein